MCCRKSIFGSFRIVDLRTVLDNYLTINWLNFFPYPCLLKTVSVSTVFNQWFSFFAAFFP